MTWITEPGKFVGGIGIEEEVASLTAVNTITRNHLEMFENEAKINGTDKLYGVGSVVGDKGATRNVVAEVAHRNLLLVPEPWRYF